MVVTIPTIDANSASLPNSVAYTVTNNPVGILICIMDACIAKPLIPLTSTSAKPIAGAANNLTEDARNTIPSCFFKFTLAN